MKKLFRCFTVAIILLLLSIPIYGQVGAGRSPGAIAREYMLSVVSAMQPEIAGVSDHLCTLETILKQSDEEVVTEILYQFWENDVWVNDTKEIHTYDGNLFPVGQLMMVWGNGAWHNSFKFEFTNNASGQMLEALGYMWSETGSEWMLMFKMTYTYQNTLISEVLMEMYMAGMWLPLSKSVFTHDAGGHMTEQLDLSWNTMNSVWENDYKYTWTYQNDRPAECLHQMWEGGAWLNEELETWAYNASGYCTEEVKMIWSGSAWENFLKATPTYNGSWQRTEELIQEWSGGVWTNWEWHQFSYNTSGYLTEKLIQVWENKGWENSEREEWIYGQVGMEEYIPGSREDIRLAVMPNPVFSDAVISFELKERSQFEINIYDITGKCIYSVEQRQHAAGLQNLKLNDISAQLGAGLYFISLSAGKQKASCKFSVVK